MVFNEGKTVPAVLAFLRETRVGQFVALSALEGDGGGGGGQVLPFLVAFFCSRFSSPLSSLFALFLLFPSSFSLWGFWEEPRCDSRVSYGLVERRRAETGLDYIEERGDWLPP